MSSLTTRCFSNTPTAINGRFKMSAVSDEGACTAGFCSLLALHPEKAIAVAALSNYSDENSQGELNLTGTLEGLLVKVSKSRFEESTIK